MHVLLTKIEVRYDTSCSSSAEMLLLYAMALVSHKWRSLIFFSLPFIRRWCYNSVLIHSL